jgi:hypothetical protein
MVLVVVFHLTIVNTYPLLIVFSMQVEGFIVPEASYPISILYRNGFPDDARSGRVPVAEHRVLYCTFIQHYKAQSKQLLTRLRVAR